MNVAQLSHARGVRGHRCACEATRGRGAPKRAAQKAPARSRVVKATTKGKKTKKGPEDGVKLKHWKIFDAEAYQAIEAWEVPWGWGTIFWGMLAWALSFVATGLLSVTAAVQFFHLDSFSSMTPLQQSQIQLATQLLSTVLGVAIVYSIGAKSEEDTPPDFLNISPADPFRFPDGWAVWAITGVATAPFAVILISTACSILPPEASGGRGTVEAVTTMIEAVDPQIFFNLVLVAGVMAPILEETVFRGFLLTSLTRFMPVPAAVAVSSFAFALCHLSLRDFPQLFALGMVMGFAYARSRNLLTSMAIHGVWNSTVMLLLFVLLSSGLTMDEIIGN